MSLQIKAQLRRTGLDIHVDAELPSEGVTALFGRSGCGKTSLLRIIAGLDRIAGAEVRFNDQPWQTRTDFVALEKRRIGLVFQGSSLLPHLGVRGNLLYGYHRTPSERRHQRPDAIIALLRLESLLARRIDELSGGQRQRVALGRALLASPQLLLLDEPLSALDSGSKREILPLLERLATETGVPIVYVSHAAAEIERLADHVALMEQGRIESIQTIQQALSRSDSPLFRNDGPASVLMGELCASEVPDLQLFRSGALTLRLALSGPAPALPAAVRLRIGARDVSLALEPLNGISILNQLPFTIEATHARAEGRVIVSGRLANGEALLAEVSAWSARELALHPGKRLFALVKAVSVID